MPTGYRTNIDGQRTPPGKQAKVRWSKAMRAAFLDHLAATCNVMGAAAAARVTPSCVYQIRRRDPVFAAQWEEALVLGYQMIETRLIGHVLAGRGRDVLVDDTDGGPGIDFDSAMRLLGQHRSATSKPRRGGTRLQFAAPDETDKMLLKRLKAIEMRRAREAEWAAQVEAGKAGLLTHDAGARDAVIEHAPQAEGARDGE